MKNKKEDNPLDASIEPEVEQRVDAMMNLDRVDSPKEARHKHSKKAEPVAPADAAPEPIDIFSDPSTAPEVNAELAKQMSVEEASEDDQEDAIQNATIPEIGQTSADAALTDTPEDPALGKAIDDIVKEEGDTVLTAEAGADDADADATASKSASKNLPPPHKSLGQKLRAFFAAWWRDKWARYITIAAVLIGILAVAVLPTPRFAVLNVAGIKGTAKLTVLDSATKLPLKNVEVSIGSASALTDKTGMAQLTGVKLGAQVLTIHKVAFTDVTENVVINMGANALSGESLRAAGNQYHFSVVDYVSGKPVTSSEATSGLASAVADKNGNVLLTSNVTTSTIKVNIAAAGYRTETVTVPVATAAVTTVQLVPARPEVFVSKASGKYDVYKMDVDGQNKQVILPGSGLETSAMSLISHATDPVVAVVSTRDNLRNADGYLLDALNIVNTTTGKTLTLDHAEQIQLIDWLGDNIVYVRIKAGTSAGNPERYQLESYNYKTSQHYELAHANGFNDIVSSGGNIYYAASNDFDGGTSIFGKVAGDGTDKQTILSIEISNIFWTDASTLSVTNGQDWYSYHIGSTQATKLASAPPNIDSNKLYIDSPNRRESAWVETRDGQGVLSVHDDTTGNDTVVAQAVGLGYPVRWLDNTTLIYRVASPKETADYIVSTLGGAPKKVTDLTNIPGVSRWYYY